MDNEYKYEDFEGNPNPPLMLTREQFDRWCHHDQLMSMEKAFNQTRSFIKLPKDVALNDYVNTGISDLIFEYYQYVMIKSDDSIILVKKDGSMDNDSITVDGAYKIAKEVSFNK